MLGVTIVIGLLTLLDVFICSIKGQFCRPITNGISLLVKIQLPMDIARGEDSSVSVSMLLIFILVLFLLNIVLFILWQFSGYFSVF